MKDYEHLGQSGVGMWTVTFVAGEELELMVPTRYSWALAGHLNQTCGEGLEVSSCWSCPW